jgi:GTP-binding protein EngB required for normal cell division
MIPTQNSISGLNGARDSSETGQPISLTNSPIEAALDLVADIVARYEISALSGLLASTRGAVDQDEITVAVLGRFKAGKSSFLNDFIGRDILPTGVIPVTASVTEIRYGIRERATVHYLDGASRDVPLDRIGAYISEKDNPANEKQVERITVDLPDLRRFAGLKFVDTPGLESALAHNTQTSLGWLPKVGLALVAVGVDPPLSQHDIDLLKSLYQYTPKVAILLTKSDLLSEGELAEVVDFVRSQLARTLPGNLRVFPYSIKPGFARFRQELTALIGDTLGNFAAERRSILFRKLETLLWESTDYLTLSLKSAERVQSERQELKQQVVGEKESLHEVKSQIRLVVQNAAAGTRSMVGGRLEAHQGELEQALLQEFEKEFPRWTRSLASMLSSYEHWLGAGLLDRLTVLSITERCNFLAPLHKVRKQAFRTLQDFRDRLSEGTIHAFGVPLRTTETEIAVLEPSTPDVRVGRVFDRSWELLSPVLPVWMIKATVRRHFERKISYLVYQNLSRLGAQWEETIHNAMWAVEKESMRRLVELIGTVERLVETSDERAPQIRIDLDRLHSSIKSLARGHE